MKKLIVTCLALATVFAYADDAVQPTDEEKAAKKAAARERMLQNTGGIIEKAGEGRAVIVDCQTKIPFEAITNRVFALNRSVRVKIDCEVCEKCRAEGFDIAKAKLPEGAGAAVFIVNDEKLPMSLVATEAGWGVLNVAALDEGKRFNKEFNRVLIMTFGGGISQLKGSPMQTVRTPEDLDKIIGEGFTFDAVTSMLKNLQNLGVTQARRSTYKRAVEEGWAPQPENEYQKVIWEKVKAEQNEAPSNPMTIEFDKEKGE